MLLLAKGKMFRGADSSAHWKVPSKDPPLHHRDLHLDHSAVMFTIKRDPSRFVAIGVHYLSFRALTDVRRDSEVFKKFQVFVLLA